LVCSNIIQYFLEDAVFFLDLVDGKVGSRLLARCSLQRFAGSQFIIFLLSLRLSCYHNIRALLVSPVLNIIFDLDWNETLVESCSHWLVSRIPLDEKLTRDWDEVLLPMSEELAALDFFLMVGQLIFSVIFFIIFVLILSFYRTFNNIHLINFFCFA